eukprot:TRINITY_DN71263_c0_g1_i1.p1 TRINITY_DN71263_c0_g1~~TRINITY_DN71263_c0_g1_i1.p1  ORF type:complete len:310 (+),score=51.37 TRINITY_DN71263_c0_g1_i1:84-1013(+)
MGSCGSASEGARAPAAAPGRRSSSTQARQPGAAPPRQTPSPNSCANLKARAAEAPAIPSADQPLVLGMSTSLRASQSNEVTVSGGKITVPTLALSTAGLTKMPPEGFGHCKVPVLTHPPRDGVKVTVDGVELTFQGCSAGLTYSIGTKTLAPTRALEWDGACAVLPVIGKRIPLYHLHKKELGQVLSQLRAICVKYSVKHNISDVVPRSRRQLRFGEKVTSNTDDGWRRDGRVVGSTPYSLGTLYDVLHESPPSLHQGWHRANIRADDGDTTPGDEAVDPWGAETTTDDPASTTLCASPALMRGNFQIG